MGPPATDAQGMDVSYYEGDIDWAAARAGGIDFAFIRVSDGVGFLDPQFATNWSEALSAGVIRGTYQFFRPEDDPTDQANLLLSNMGTLLPGDIPPVLDVEVSDGVSAGTIDANIATWVSVIQQATGTTPLIYTAEGFWDELGEGSQSTTLWVANWGVSSPALPNSWSQYTFWQWTDAGTVSGISGSDDVDLDVFHGTLSQLQAWAGATQPTPTPQPTASPTPSASPTASPAPSPTPIPNGVSYGVDLSTYDGTVNWSTLESDFALIRVSDGESLDDQFAANWSGAYDAGMVRGAFQLFEPGDSATNQANLLLQAMGTLQPGDLPPTLDVELTGGYSASHVLSGIATWISVVRQATGMTPMIRTSPGFWDQLGAGTESTPLWVMHWDVSSPASDLPNSWNSWQFWQYSATGTVGGIPGSAGGTDLDQYNGSPDQLVNYAFSFYGG